MRPSTPGAGVGPVFPVPGLLPDAGCGDGLVDLARAREQLPPGPFAVVRLSRAGQARQVAAAP
jgi:hypothetical protein